MGSANASEPLAVIARRCAMGTGGAGRTFSRLATHHQVMPMAKPIMTPGTMPARNSLVMDTLAATPKMMKPMEGGITGAMMPPAAISPAERPTSYPAARIMGMSSAASAAVSATAEPDSDAMMMAAMTATEAKPPRKCPTQAMARFTMRRLSPPAFMNSPANKKNGTASNGKLSAPSTKRCARIWLSKAGKPPVAARKAIRLTPHTSNE